MAFTILTWLVDSFTNTKFKGNPAAVCIVENFDNCQKRLFCKMSGKWKIKSYKKVKG